MFECSVCTLRAIRAIAGERLVATRPRKHLLLTPHFTRRKASTATASTSGHNGAPYLNAAQLRHEEVTQSDAFVPLIRRHETKDPEPAHDRQLAASKDFAVRKELQWLADPAKLAEHVHYTLRCNNPEKALELCCMASNKMQCVVSWNHVVDWHMKQGRVQDALKVYNDMKKRAQFPDAYTYTLLLRGLVGLQSKNKRMKVPEEHVSKAVSIYHSMSSPTSRVQPTIIHTNAALSVCAQGHDMDALWGIAGKLPEIGAGAADHVTYSIILNAIRHEVTRLAFDAGPQAATSQREKALHEGRRVWMEVIQKWRDGQIKLDEQLVCAMARVLLVSHRLPDWDDVLSLTQQTMQIERLVAAYGTPERQIGHVPQVEGPQEVISSPSASEAAEHDGYVETPAAKAFKSVQPLPASKAKRNRPTTLAYVQPGNDTLSVLIEACTLMRTPKTASAYWNLLTTAHNIKPDIHNFNAQLRLLHKNRASAQAARLLKEDLADAGVKPLNLTFRIAMDTCARDWKNNSALDHATSILNTMESTLADLDVETLKKYLSLALNTNSGPKVVAVLDRLDSALHNLRSRIFYGPADQKMSPQADLRDKQETLSFFRVLVGAVDTLMDRGLVPREDYGHWHARRDQLTRFVGRGTKSVAGSEKKLVGDGRLGEDGGVNKVMFLGRKELHRFRARGVGGTRRGRGSGDGKGSSGGDLRRRSDGDGRRRSDGEVKAGEKGMEDFAASPADLGM